MQGTFGPRLRDRALAVYGEVPPEATAWAWAAIITFGLNFVPVRYEYNTSGKWVLPLIGCLGVWGVAVYPVASYIVVGWWYEAQGIMHGFRLLYITQEPNWLKWALAVGWVGYVGMPLANWKSSNSATENREED